MSHQLSHKENKFTPSQFNITILCDHLEGPANQGALFRVCEAFNVKEIIFFGNFIDINSSRLKRTARNTEKTVTYNFISEISELSEYFDSLKNTLFIGLEITSESIPIQEISIKNDTPILLVIGNEKNGISKKLLTKLNKTYHIPMYGTNSSMNVIQSTAIALYEITNNLLK